MTWHEWIAIHARIFGMTGDAEMGMLAEWTHLFSSAGFDPAEMELASRWVALNATPRFRSDQLQALLSRARAVRARELTNGSTEDSAPSCGLCGGSGMVSVPNPKAIARGRFALCSVLCSCPKANQLRFAREARAARQDVELVQQQTIDQYEDEVPNWRAIMEQHRQELLALSRSRGYASSLDKTLGRIMERIRQQERG